MKECMWVIIVGMLLAAGMWCGLGTAEGWDTPEQIELHDIMREAEQRARTVEAQVREIEALNRLRELQENR